MMKTKNKSHGLRAVSLTAGIAFALSIANGTETDSASDAEVLLKLFQDKGLVTAEEAEAARAKLADRPAPPVESPDETSPVRTAEWIERIDLFGDARLRFEHRSGKDGSTAGDDRMERNRWRYRLRGGAKMEFAEDFRAGIRLETGSSGRSTNVTFGDDSGPWGKNSDGVNVGQIYLNWTPADWFGTTVGRQPVPFEVTGLVWDGDLNPEGLSETFAFKARNADLFATFGQFVYDDANPDNPFGAGVDYTDAFLFVNQVGARYNFNEKVSAQVAPVLHIYSGQGDDFRGPFVGTTPANSVGINDLLVLAIPMEVTFSPGQFPARVFGDFAVNLDGKDRARAAGTPDADDEIFAWQAGVEIGSTKKKGGWKARTFYQSSGLYALDANMVDSDLFDSRLNMKGFVLQGAYAFTDFLTFTLTYANADRKDKDLPTGAFGDIGGGAGTAYLEDYQLFQGDISFKF